MAKILYIEEFTALSSKSESNRARNRQQILSILKVDGHELIVSHDPTEEETVVRKFDPDFFGDYLIICENSILAPNDGKNWANRLVSPQKQTKILMLHDEESDPNHHSALNIDGQWKHLDVSITAAIEALLGHFGP